MEITEYQKQLHQIAEQLNHKNIQCAYKAISEAMATHMDAPEPHNLLGIYYELKNDYILARKHYRAAYALDPTYKPVRKNLERLCSWCWGFKAAFFDMGIDDTLGSLTSKKPRVNNGLYY